MGLVAAPSTANAQASGGCNLTGSDVISDRVAGTFSITDAADGSARLEAVILARGRPGWAGDSPPSGIYESPPPPPGGRVRLLAGGGVGRLMLVYERFTGVAWCRVVPRGAAWCRCAVASRSRSRGPSAMAATHHYELGPHASAQIDSPARRLASHSFVRAALAGAS